MNIRFNTHPLTMVIDAAGELLLLCIATPDDVAALNPLYAVYFPIAAVAAAAKKMYDVAASLLRRSTCSLFDPVYAAYLPSPDLITRSLGIEGMVSLCRWLGSLYVTDGSADEFVARVFGDLFIDAAYGREDVLHFVVQCNLVSVVRDQEHRATGLGLSVALASALV